jgi:hypothetical protein
MPLVRGKVASWCDVDVVCDGCCVVTCVTHEASVVSRHLDSREARDSDSAESRVDQTKPSPQNPPFRFHFSNH